jgi:hypothetical protein
MPASIYLCLLACRFLLPQRLSWVTAAAGRTAGHMHAAQVWVPLEPSSTTELYYTVKYRRVRCLCQLELAGWSLQQRCSVLESRYHDLLRLTA